MFICMSVYVYITKSSPAPKHVKGDGVYVCVW